MYTGAHKTRFNEDGSGKVKTILLTIFDYEIEIKGIDGRYDKVDNSGYVGAYKGAGTYGKK